MFVKERRYATDIRYLKLWLLYAKYVDSPREIFRFLEANEIGSHAAVFYEEWAAIEEAAANYKEADVIFNLGVARRAEPLSRLQKKRDAFQARMLLIPAEERSRSTSSNARSALAMSQPAIQPLQTNSVSKANGSAFAVFSDDSENRATASTWDDFGTRDSRRRENHMEGTKWAGEKLPMRPASNQPQLGEKLEVYRDEVGGMILDFYRADLFQDADQPAATSHDAPSLGFKSIRAPSEAEALRANPFKHYPNADLSFADMTNLEQARPVLRPTTTKAAKLKPKMTALATAQTTASERKERVASPLEEIYPDDNPTTNLKYVENSFEEIMAMRRGLYSRDGERQQAIWQAHEQQEWLQEVRKSGGAAFLACRSKSLMS